MKMLSSIVIVFCFSTAISCTMSAAGQTKNGSMLDQAYAEEIKEYHFHVYFFQGNTQSTKQAENLSKQIKELVKLNFFHPVPGKINYGPAGQHPIGNYEVWCPKEHFSRVYSWFLLHRGSLSVLVHPLTRHQLLDYTDRAAFMGASLPFDLTRLTVDSGSAPLQYPDLRMGYSAK